MSASERRAFMTTFVPGQPIARRTPYRTPLLIRRPQFPDNCIGARRAEKLAALGVDELEDHLDYKRWYYEHFHRDANPAERHTVLYDCIVRLGDELQPWDVA